MYTQEGRGSFYTHPTPQGPVRARVEASTYTRGEGVSLNTLHASGSVRAWVETSTYTRGEGSHNTRHTAQGPVSAQVEAGTYTLIFLSINITLGQNIEYATVLKCENIKYDRA